MEKKLYAVVDLKAEGNCVFGFLTNSDPEAIRIFDDFIGKEQFLQRYPDDFALVHYFLPVDLSCQTLCVVADRVRYFASKAQAEPEQPVAEGEGGLVDE